MNTISALGRSWEQFGKRGKNHWTQTWTFCKDWVPSSWRLWRGNVSHSDTLRRRRLRLPLLLLSALFLGEWACRSPRKPLCYLLPILWHLFRIFTPPLLISLLSLPLCDERKGFLRPFAISSVVTTCWLLGDSLHFFCLCQACFPLEKYCITFGFSFSHRKGIITLDLNNCLRCMKCPRFEPWLSPNVPRCHDSCSFCYESLTLWYRPPSSSSSVFAPFFTTCLSCRERPRLYRRVCTRLIDLYCLTRVIATVVRDLRIDLFPLSKVGPSLFWKCNERPFQSRACSFLLCNQTFSLIIMSLQRYWSKVAQIWVWKMYPEKLQEKKLLIWIILQYWRYWKMIQRA